MHSILLIPVCLVCLAATASAAEEKVVIPFDFVSKFDDGRYGQKVGELIWKKLDRLQGFEIPKTMLDTRDFCKRHNLHPSPELPLEKMQQIVRDDFAAHIGIFGSVERVPGHEWDVYQLVIKCVDFSGGTPRIIYRCDARTKVVSEIPHVYVKQMLDALYGRTPPRPPPVDLLAEKNWKKNPNLVAGDFERGAGGVPVGWDAHWEAGEVSQRERLGRTVQWLTEAGNPTNHMIRFTLHKSLGDTTGVAYYGDFFPVDENARYRFQCRWRSTGPAVKVFVKGYAEQRDEHAAYPARGIKESQSSRKGAVAAGGPGYVRRQVYRSQQDLKGPKNTWNTHTQDFTPKHSKVAPRWGRVMLYAYVGAGVVEFDDVVVKQIGRYNEDGSPSGVNLPGDAVR